eukprot:1195733-Prorocentrum_minimum.AAC.5
MKSSYETATGDRGTQAAFATEAQTVRVVAPESTSACDLQHSPLRVSLPLRGGTTARAAKGSQHA